jgi:hypothetical protein
MVRRNQGLRIQHFLGLNIYDHEEALLKDLTWIKYRGSKG